MSRPALPLGTVRPGPRGYGWRVKATTGKNGWVPCDEFGNHLAVAAPRRRTLATIVEQAATAPVSPEMARAMAVRAREIGRGFPSDNDRRARARRAAAGNLSPHLKDVLDTVRTACRYGGGATYTEIAGWINAHPGSVSKRLLTLRDAGLIRGEGKRNGQRIYVLTQDGRKVSV